MKPSHTGLCRGLRLNAPEKCRKGSEEKGRQGWDGGQCSCPHPVRPEVGAPGGAAPPEPPSLNRTHVSSKRTRFYLFFAPFCFLR